MRYMGGKDRVGKHIAQVLIARSGGRRVYIEPFVGGAGVFSKVAPEFDRAYASDVVPDLVMMWNAVLDGWVPPRQVSREEYYELKKAEPSALRGFVGFGCSFGGRWFEGYAASDNRQDYCAEAQRAVLRKAQGMAGSTVRLCDYREWQPGAGDVVYCDPPYANTKPYSGTQTFDSPAFWATADRWATRGALVFVSEFVAPDGVECVWSRARRITLGKDTDVVPVTEKLFMLG